MNPVLDNPTRAPDLRAKQLNTAGPAALVVPAEYLEIILTNA
jgi:hypothetical protein